MTKTLVGTPDPPEPEPQPVMQWTPYITTSNAAWNPGTTMITWST